MRFSVERIMRYQKLAREAADRRNSSYLEFQNAKGDLQAAELELEEYRSESHSINPMDQRQENSRVALQDRVYAAVPAAKSRFEASYANYHECRQGPLPAERQWEAIRLMLRSRSDTPPSIRELI